MNEDFMDEVSGGDAVAMGLSALEEVGVLLGEMGVNDDYFLGRGLVRFTDASSEELVVVQVDDDGREHELVAGAGEAWLEMKAAGLVDVVSLEMVSAYRSAERQAEIVRGKVLRGLGVDEIFSVSAPPGFSEHHTGKAVDISTPGYAALEEEFEGSEAFAWLGEYGGKFGFTMTYGKGNVYGFLYEPWHWCFSEDASLKEKA